MCFIFSLTYPLLNRHGFLIDLRKVLEHLMEDHYNWPSVNLILAANMFAIAALLLERCLDKGTLSPSAGHCLHLGNLGLLTLFPAVIILYDTSISTGGAYFSLWTYTVLGLKLYSYQETNSWYRQGSVPSPGTDKCVLHETKKHIEHLPIKDLYYFLLAPTLCYQRNFPFTPRVRINVLCKTLIEMVVLTQIIVGVVQQVICFNFWVWYSIILLFASLSFYLELILK
ncbi:unnamed protein product [Oncorhynchus mykiss]|uniref:diacylglycerol O-acyltransferase n=1 Tax=Oncorhynchus mykiss TaxID=8022 RepID=A0A060WD04_ONCMY|nr:unnamed protein product [Oncorhynchus mykiss]